MKDKEDMWMEGNLDTPGMLNLNITEEYSCIIAGSPKQGTILMYKH